jgi:FkbM family methyltransferase
MKKIIKKLPFLYKRLLKIKQNCFDVARKSYSQFGEDLVLSTFCKPNKKNKGFYVDVGAYHPKRFSNTYFYYKRGWRGINIDAKPGSMDIFKKKRKRDINIETGVSSVTGTLDFFIFKEPAYNTFSKERADKLISSGIDFDRKEEVGLERLEDLLDNNIPKGICIDFLSIDVEGLDLDVLKSNNWSKYKPKFILVEMGDFNIETIKDSEIYKYLISKGYKLLSVVYITLIFGYE